MDSLEADQPATSVATLPGRRGSAEPVETEPPDKRGHFPPLDGLRGVAILLVICHHFFRPAYHGSRILGLVLGINQAGWVGVNLFFVLSGFLISGILIDSRGKLGYYRTFYARRSLRIFPLYYAFLLVFYLIVPPATAALGHPIDRPEHGWLYFLYLANMKGLFVAGPFPHLLDPLWSLSVEEQVYLAWPALIAFCPRRWLLGLMAAMVPASLAFRVAVLALHQPIDYAYALTPSCLDAFGAGAVAAILIRTAIDRAVLRRWAGRVFLVAGIALVALAASLGSFHFWVVPKATLTIGLTGVSVFFAAAILAIVSAPTTTPINRLLSMRWLRGVGKYSYAMYLFHMPVGEAIETLALSRLDEWTVFRTVPGQVVYVLITFLVTYLLALASWNLLEKHVLKFKKAFPSSGRGVPSIATDRAS